MRLARADGIERLQAPGRGAEQTRGVAAAPEVEGDLRAHALKLGAAELVQRPGVGGRQQRLRGQEVRGFDLARAAARARDARCPGSAVNVTALSRNAAEAAMPAAALCARRRVQQLLGDVVIGAVAACARCQARRSGSLPGSVAAASAA